MKTESNVGENKSLVNDEETSIKQTKNSPIKKQSKTKKNQVDEKFDLESSLKRVEEILHKMEDDSTSLDEKISLYAEGVKLSRSCLDELDKAKGKITEIKNGKEENIDNG